jgi:2-(1,2-epoxy-1,2-dihydrophenyl)acetyl-CoA isomerase
MTYERLTYEVANNIAWITINRPGAYNAIDLQTAKELLHVANRIPSDPTVKAAVLTGAGTKAFCAGGDVASFHAHQDDLATHIKEITQYLHMAVSRFAWMDAPLIAAVNGVAAGAGLSLAAAADLAIAADTATFTSAYTKLGFTPDGSSTYHLSRILGTRRAMELYLTNRTLTATEAQDWGLTNRTVPQKDLIEETTKLAAQLAQGPLKAHGGVKKLLLTAITDSLESQMERETRAIVATATTRDGQEGIQAFLEKRRPRFQQ